MIHINDTRNVNFDSCRANNWRSLSINLISFDQHFTWIWKLNRYISLPIIIELDLICYQTDCNNGHIVEIMMLLIFKWGIFLYIGYNIKGTFYFQKIIAHMDAYVYFYELEIHIWGTKTILILGNIFRENSKETVWFQGKCNNYFSNKKFNYLNSEKNLFV